MATGVKGLQWELEEAVHVDHRACLPDPVHGLHNVSLRCIWRFDAALRGGVQNGARPVQILRDGDRTDIRRPWHDRYWAGPAAAAADPWQTRLTHGYAAAREAAMAAFAKTWRRKPNRTLPHCTDCSIPYAYRARPPVWNRPALATYGTRFSNATEERMMVPRRRFPHLAAIAAALLAVSPIANAQGYPSRTVRIVVGFPPGQAIDMSARLMAEWLQQRLGQTFIVENRPGAAAQRRYRDGGALSGGRLHASGHFLEQRDQHHALWHRRFRARNCSHRHLRPRLSGSQRQ